MWPTRLPNFLFPPRRTSSLEGSPSINIPPPIERENNIMTQGELDCFRESYSIPSNVQIRLPEANGTIASTHLGEVAFYECCELTNFPSPSTSLGACSHCKKIQNQTPYGSISRLGKRCNRLPILSSTEQKRLDEILDLLVGGDTFKIMDVLESKSFHRCFKSTPTSMASSGGDNSEDIPVGWVTPVVAMSKKISLKKLTQMVKRSKGQSPATKSSPATKGVVIGKKHPERSVAASNGAKLIAALGEGTLAKLGNILGPNASRGVVVLASSLAKRGRELKEGTMIQATEELKKVKEEWDAMVARLEVENAKLKKKAIAEFKASDEFQKAVEFIASRYFGNGFDFCKRKIRRPYPDLDIVSMGIDADLLEKEEEEEEKDGEKEGEKEEEKKHDEEKGDTSPLSP
ncbi:hypothetical protein Acr_00g0037160 [Actinidia rufa]|uniref:Uncharacterized protein n=1 Tax=Actinidia rufa TaxID=165716 RepID=A0A7J0DGW1_9ERIC|nr:hypothetical protein Acr_00g0037160 [Actinidia rufa]